MKLTKSFIKLPGDYDRSFSFGICREGTELYRDGYNAETTHTSKVYYVYTVLGKYSMSLGVEITKEKELY